jgi:hypothetical protein
MISKDLNTKIVSLRKAGKTYSEITKETNISKGTLSYLLKGIELSDLALAILARKTDKARNDAREKAVYVNKYKRDKYLTDLKNSYSYLSQKIKGCDEGLIALSMLYFGEGSKTNKSHLTLGNSSPELIRIFIYLLRNSFEIDETKFRCTLQCRSDQKIEELEHFWSDITNIPKSQFYTARIDPRTIGKPSRKLDYKGVCRLEYLCADIYHRIMIIIETITGL